MYNKHLPGLHIWQYGCWRVSLGAGSFLPSGRGEIGLDIDSRQVMLSGHPALQ